MRRRKYIKAIGAGAAGVSVGLTAHAEAKQDGYLEGERPIRIIVPFDAGGGTDLYARQIFSKVSDITGNPTQVDNIPGAATLRGAGEGITAEPDGHTITAFNPPSTPLSAMLEEPPFDLRDFEGIMSHSRGAFALLANPEFEFEGVQDVIDRYDDGEIELMGGQSPGGITHATAFLIQEEWGMNWDRYVGFPGAAPIAEALASGEIPVAITSEAGSAGAIDEGQVEIVSMLPSDGGVVFEDAPVAVDEGFSNIDFIAQFNRAYWFPPETPQERIDTMEGILEEAVTSDEIQGWAEETDNHIWFRDQDFANQVMEDAFTRIPEAVDLEELREAAAS